MYFDPTYIITKDDIIKLVKELKKWEEASKKVKLIVEQSTPSPAHFSKTIDKHFWELS